jgi:hypothetical protein
MTLHNNRGSYVSFLEYLIGRVSGKFSAGDPRGYRREKKKTQNLFGNNSRNDAAKLGSARDSTTDVFECETLKESLTKNNTDKQYSPLHPSFQSLHETADHKQTMDGFHEFYEGIHILAEIKTLLSTHCSPEQVQSVLFGWNSYIFSAKNLQKLFNYRAWLLSQVKRKESLEKLSPIGQVPMISFDWLWRPTNNRANFENKATSSFFNAFTSQQQSCRGNSHSALSKSTPTSDENKSSQKDSRYSIPEIPTVPEIPL